MILFFFFFSPERFALIHIEYVTNVEERSHTDLPLPYQQVPYMKELLKCVLGGHLDASPFTLLNASSTFCFVTEDTKSKMTITPCDCF